MKKLRKRIQRYSQIIAGSYRKCRRAFAERSPLWLRRLVSPVLEYYDLFMVDHGIFRSLYSNTHQVTPDLWRSSQPAPYQIRRFARRGVRTVINLRGKRDCGSYRLEAAACERYGVKLIDFPYARSRSAPNRLDLARIKALFDEIEYPALVHCKSGADRAGLVSSLYLLFKEGRPAEQAMDQLHIRYGHIKQAETGVLDYFFEQYLAYNHQTPTPFPLWVEAAYDSEGLKRSFRSRSWADLVVNRLVRRE
jgi:protein tyrosine/serine phosphatase